MSKGDTFENDLLKLIFTATAIANLAQDGASPVTSLYVALHTADPGEAGDQTTNEIAYNTYARIAVSRNAAGWTVTNNNAINAAAITFPTCNSGSGTASHFSVGMNATSASKILYSGALTANLAISAGITPAFNAGNLTCSED